LRHAWADEERLDLTTAELNPLEHLLRNAARVVSRDVLCAVGRRPSERSIDRNVDTLVSKVRRKLDRPSDPDQRIKTVRNGGYLYALSSR
jgi:DNA-binding response OmpR family regulator